MLYLLYTETKPNLASLVATYFDGAHLRQGKGLWEGVVEDSTVIEIVVPYEHLDVVLRLAEAIKKENKQEAVLLVKVNAEHVFV